MTDFEFNFCILSYSSIFYHILIINTVFYKKIKPAIKLTLFIKHNL